MEKLLHEDFLCERNLSWPIALKALTHKAHFLYQRVLSIQIPIPCRAPCPLSCAAHSSPWPLQIDVIRHNPHFLDMHLRNLLLLHHLHINEKQRKFASETKNLIQRYILVSVIQALVVTLAGVDEGMDCRNVHHWQAMCNNQRRQGSCLLLGSG